MCELLVGLPDVNVDGVGDWPGWLRIAITSRASRPLCPGCAGRVWGHGRVEVELVDLPCFGRRTRLVWSKQRRRCPNPNCGVVTFVESDDRIATERAGMTDRAGRWATFQVGHHGRAVSEVAADLGCDWHTVMDAVNHHGRPLIDDPNRIGKTVAVGLDEVLFCRSGKFKRRCWSTQVVDVARGQLLDIVPGRDAASCCRWFAAQPDEWVDGIVWATLDLSGSYRSVFDTMLPHAIQIADPFHVVKLANFVLDEVRRRVQNETLGHRGRKTDPLYRSRKLMTIAHERLDDESNLKLVGLLEAGDPRGEVRNAWHAKEVVRSIYAIDGPETAVEFVSQLGIDLQDDSCPPEIRRLGRTITKWRQQIAAWHQARFTNGPTEAVNNLIKRVKRVAFGITNWTNYRTRSLLYAGKPDWTILGINPR
ncbi:MAG: ISL3 family transposase [Ilumatobacter sp.]|uniref:ISL3 family transposase n=1 Tax=Ilumatobacter sp. TaxID=1967498 RepID=UPI0032968439